MPLVPALSKQRQADSCAFKASLGYISKFQASLGYTVETLPQKGVGV